MNIRSTSREGRRPWARSLVTTLCVMSLFTSGACGGEDDEQELFSEEQAGQALESWVASLVARDMDAIVKGSTVPFRFRSRSWSTREQLRKNLPAQIAGLEEALGRADQEGGSIDYYSHRDLMQGRWPERRTVAEENRDAEISKLGIRPNGYIAWVHVGRKTVARFILNPPQERNRLLVQGIDPR